MFSSFCLSFSFPLSLSLSLMLPKTMYLFFSVYKSPEYDKLLYKYIIERLIVLGYSERLREFNYEANFAVRGKFGLVCIK